VNCVERLLDAKPLDEIQNQLRLLRAGALNFASARNSLIFSTALAIIFVLQNFFAKREA